MLGNHANAELTDRVLSDNAKRNALIEQVLVEVQAYGIDGINVDFENVWPRNRAVLTTFVVDLAQALHKLNRKLSIDVSPDTYSDWTDAFDYNRLGYYADYVMLMGYDEHWDGSPVAGSVSSLPWLQRALDQLLTVVPARKTIVGVPFYTRDWAMKSPVSSENLTLVEQGVRIRDRGAGQVWNPSLMQYESAYNADGVTHRIWMEESRSLSAKVAMASIRGVGGFAYWYIDAETTDVWPALANAMRYAGFNF